MSVIDVVKWEAGDDVYAWRYPSQELGTWTQLIVAESQEAVLVKEGRMLGPFRAGRHSLDTNNIPFIRDFVKIPTGGRTPFTAEVWFVNKAIPLDVKWGTGDPIQLQDPVYGIMLTVRAFGQYGVQVEDTKKFLQKLVGTIPCFTREQLTSYFRGVILTIAKTAIAQHLVRDKISLLEIGADLEPLSNSLRERMLPELEQFGLRLVKFFVTSINAPESDPAVAQLKRALAKRAEMNILGYTYQQERSFDTLETAAGNPGSMQSGLMGAGIGIGLGAGIGSAIAPAMAPIVQNLQPAPVTCPKCRAVAAPNNPFCANCGARVAPPPQPETVCPSCGKGMPAAAKFCSECGKSRAARCAACAAELSPGAKFCFQCGARVSEASS